MKVLLIYPPIENEISSISLSEVDTQRGYLPPLGVLYLASYLKKHTDFAVDVVDCGVEGITHARLPELIRDRAPDIVGISVMTHFLVDGWLAAQAVKKHSPRIVTVVGGPHAMIYPVTTAALADIDYAVKGEGEAVFCDLVRAIAAGQSAEEIAAIPGVASKVSVSRGLQDKDIELVRVNDLDAVPFPDRSLLPYRKYSSVLSASRFVTTMITSRGCPFRCIFCDRMGKKFRPASAGCVLEEIESILRLGIQEIFIHDDTFSVDRKRVIAICEGILSRNLKFHWDARTRVNCVDFEQLALMKKSGCERISFGIESGDPGILKNLRKGITLEQAEKVFGWCRQLGISTLADFMIGSPGETRKEIAETVKFVKKIKPHYAQFSIVCPYPDTDLYREALQRGLIDHDVWLEFARHPSRDFRPPIWGEHFTREELEKIAKELYRSFYLSPHFILAELGKVRSLRQVGTKLKAGLKLLRF